MDLSDVTVHVLVKNESYWIRSVLTPFIGRVKDVIVFDTGSTDGTPEIASSLGARVFLRGNLSPKEIGACRGEMCKLTQTKWCWCVDGDELYHEDAITQIEQQPMPKGKFTGFIPMVSIDWKPETTTEGLPYKGEFWELNDKFSRLAIYPASTTFSRDYPFEGPDCFDIPSSFHYFEMTQAFHLHRLNRSPVDHEVYIRKDKQFLFCLDEKPDLKFVNPVVLNIVGENPYT